MRYNAAKASRRKAAKHVGKIRAARKPDGKRTRSVGGVRRAHLDSKLVDERDIFREARRVIKTPRLAYAVGIDEYSRLARDLL